MGNAASKSPKAARKYPAPSTLPNYPHLASTTPTQTRTPFPPSAQNRPQHPADVRAKLEGMPSGLDPKLAARLNELGPVTVPKPSAKIPAKADDMMTILRTRAEISRIQEEGQEGPRKFVPIAIIKEIILAREKGWDSERICKEYNVDPSVVQKLENHIALPVDNEDGSMASEMKNLHIMIPPPLLLPLECTISDRWAYYFNRIHMG